MRFGRKKSEDVSVDSIERQRRNKLSKPLTNKSTSNLRAVATTDHLDERNTSALSVYEDAPSGDPSLSREDILSHLFGHDQTTAASRPSVTNLPAKMGVASLVAQYEAGRRASSQSSLLANGKTRKPLSAFIDTANSIGTQHSQDNRPGKLGNYNQSSATRSPLSPRASEYFDPEPMDETYKPPMRRRSTFNPGERTRLSEDGKENERSEQTHAVNNSDDDALSFKEGTEEEKTEPFWIAPLRQSDRPTTPQSLNQRPMGAFQMGSLHVVNGRVSPSLSMATSVAPLHPRIRELSQQHSKRDASSEYGDSEKWEDESIVDDASEPPSDQAVLTESLERSFSYSKGDEDILKPREQYDDGSRSQDEHPRTPSSKSDRASILATEYISDIGGSPFEVTPGSSITSSSASSTGSVVRHHLESDPEDFEFYDEAVSCSPSRETPRAQSAQLQFNTRQAGTESRLSAVPSHLARDEVFQSALEFQAPEAPSLLRPPLSSKPTEQSDSGYSSNNSLRSASPERIQNVVTNTQIPQLAQNGPSLPPKDKLSPKKLGGFLPTRPALKSRVTAPAVSEKLTNHKTSSPLSSTTVLSVQSEQTPFKPNKFAKKLQKKTKPFSKTDLMRQPKEIIVQSMSDFSTAVPPVSSTASKSLSQRCHVMPELQHTVQQSIDRPGTASTLAVPGSIRFPSPGPDPDSGDDERTIHTFKQKSRARSKSRRRSFLDMFKSGKNDDRRKSDCFDGQVVISDMGDVMAYLGTNPYDIALPNHSAGSRVPSTQSCSPSHVSVQRARPKSMMDAATAAEMARHRSFDVSHNILPHHKEQNLETCTHWPSAPTRTPPMPPTQAPKLTRNFSRPHVSRPSPSNGMFQNEHLSVEEPYPSEAESFFTQRPSSWAPAGNSERWAVQNFTEPESAPPPPPHSPQPLFLGLDGLEDLEGEADLGPPPPCHSPQPLQIAYPSHQVSEDSWAEYARAWKVRRQSAGDALRAWKASSEPEYAEYNGLVRSYPDVDAQYSAGQLPLAPFMEQDDSQYSAHWSAPLHLYEQDEAFHYQQGPRDALQDPYGRNEPHQPSNESFLGQYEVASYETKSSQFYETQARPLPQLLPNQPTSRPRSQLSQHSNRSFISNATSLAEELHPADLERKSPAPDYGRYSGGLQFGYEGRDTGFGGSAGTRSMSGKAEAHWKGLAMRESFGIDLGDVPIMGKIVKA